MTITMKNGRTSVPLLQNALYAMSLTVVFNGVAVLETPTDRSVASISLGNLNTSHDPAGLNAIGPFQGLAQTQSSCAPPNILAMAWANMSLNGVTNTQKNTDVCPIKTVRRGVPGCDPDSDDPNSGLTNGLYMFADVLLNNPLNTTVSFSGLNASMSVMPDHTPIVRTTGTAGSEGVDYTMFQRGFPLGSMNDSSHAIRQGSTLPDGSPGAIYTSPDPLITLKPFERAVFSDMVCLDVCLYFLLGSFSDQDTPGFMGYLGSGGAKPSYVNARFYPDVPASYDVPATWLDWGRGVEGRPASLMMNVTGSVSARIGELAIDLDVPAQQLPMTQFFSA